MLSEKEKIHAMISLGLVEAQVPKEIDILIGQGGACASSFTGLKVPSKSGQLTNCRLPPVFPFRFSVQWRKGERKINTWAFFTLPFLTKGKMRMMRSYIFNEHMITHLNFGPSMDYINGALDDIYKGFTVIGLHWIIFKLIALFRF